MVDIKIFLEEYYKRRDKILGTKTHNKLSCYWTDFWYKYHSPSVINYGGPNRGYYTFRWQRLYNIFVLIFVLIALYNMII